MNPSDRFAHLSRAMIAASLPVEMRRTLLAAAAADLAAPAASQAPGFDEPGARHRGLEDESDAAQSDPATQAGWDLAFSRGETR